MDCVPACLLISNLNFPIFVSRVLGSIVVSIPACHAGDRGSIPRRGGAEFFFLFILTRALVIDISSEIFVFTKVFSVEV